MYTGILGIIEINLDILILVCIMGQKKFHELGSSIIVFVASFVFIFCCGNPYKIRCENHLKNNPKHVVLKFLFYTKLIF